MSCLLARETHIMRVSSQCEHLFYTPGPALSASPLPLTLSVGDPPANGQLNVLVLAKTGALKNYFAASAGLLICEWGFLSIWWHLRPLITE